MLKNYFKIAWRNIRNNKVFSILNIIGLAIGLLCSLLIFLWVTDELKTDKHHENIDNLFAVYERVDIGGEISGMYYTPALLFAELKSKIPEIERASATVPKEEKTFENGNIKFKQNGTFTDEDYFKMFSYDFIAGSKENALDAPNKIVISQEMAELFFGSVNAAMGQSIKYEDRRSFQVSAVYDESDKTVSEKYDFFLPWEFYKEEDPWNTAQWENNYPYTYIQLSTGADVGNVQKKILGFLKDYNPNINETFNIELYLQPFGDKYLHSNLENGFVSGGRIDNVRIFGLIAFFILLIACINFMNLASSISIKRSKEVGVRKVLGAKKNGLIYQFLGESVLLSFISMLLAIILLIILLPYFNDLASKDIQLLNLPWSSWSAILGISLFAGLISGIYPAFVLSSFSAVSIFKKNISFNSSSKLLRKGLVVFQFSLSIILISGMLITSKQINFIQNKNLGFDRNNVVAIPLNGDLEKSITAFKSRALQFSGVESLSTVSENPIELTGSTFDITWKGKPENDLNTFTSLVASPDFSKTWGSEIIEGQDFKDNNPDNIGFILNETAVNAMKLIDPIGQPLTQWGKEGTIVGVMKDFHFESMKSSIKPLVIRSEGYLDFNYILVRINPVDVSQTITSLESLHSELNPAFPFTYNFTDQEYGNLYKSETIFLKLSQYFSFMAIFISCLGLFGLVIFTAQQRIKEIGIRKVLGASVSGITILLAKDFIKLVLVGIVIGSPISWYLMNRWLSNFEYRIDMPWWAFGASGILAVGIALFTLSFESIKSALANPVKSLRSE